MKKNEPMQIKSTKRKFKVPFARKNEEEEIPFEKESFSSAEMINTTGQKKTTLGKSVGVQDEEKLCADNITPYNIIKRPSLIKEYRYNEFERAGRLARNRAKDIKGQHYFFTLDVLCLSS